MLKCALTERFYGHRSDIIHKENKPVSNHFSFKDYLHEKIKNRFWNMSTKPLECMLATEKLDIQQSIKQRKACRDGLTLRNTPLHEILPSLSPPPGEHADSNVVTLLIRHFPRVKYRFLSRGLSFVPTPTAINHLSILNDIQQFSRRHQHSVFYTINPMMPTRNFPHNLEKVLVGPRLK